MSGLSSAIVHLTMRFDERTLSTGSGVFYKKDDKYYVITAWHNVTGRHTETLNFLDKKHSAVPNNITLAFKMHVFGGFTNMSVAIPLYDENHALFYVHPDNWPRVDVVAIPFDPFAVHTTPCYMGDNKEPLLISLGDGTGESPIRAIQDYLAPRNLTEKWMEAVDVTEEVFIPSYPHNITDDYYNPVWKRATIASDPKIEWNRERKFLIDSASSSGMSGASVFYYNTQGQINIRGSSYNLHYPAAIHAGIYVGRIGVTDKADPQVGTVWHASVVDEIIDGKVFDLLQFEIEMDEKNIETSIKDYLKRLSEKGLENLLNPDSTARYYTHSAVLKDIKGRYNPDKLMQLILKVASVYDGPLVDSE
ncbi:hypothetical protein ACIPSD_06905 [Pectobacterium sp. CHL-2024]|uniref:hypothetical protein n=1 Tax=Pectobacterium sp. CHL-2024 TaxID=3377079 RepID=UPI0037F308C9